MRLAVFSDIHANLEALQAFISQARELAIDRYVCLGDVIGYGADPVACLELVQSLPHLSWIKGNHEAAACWEFSPQEMSPLARQAIEWTMDRLSPDQIAEFQDLETSIDLEGMRFAHANPYNPSGWGYVTSRFQAARCFASAEEPLIFIGHTHQRQVITRQGRLKMDLARPKADEALTLAESPARIINCGSIGQPRDGSPKGSWLIVDTLARRAEYQPLSYDIALAAAKIRAAGLPGALADRLTLGR